MWQNEEKKVKKMQEVQNRGPLESCLEKHRSRALFDPRDLPFRMYRREAGETMNILRQGQEYPCSL